MIYLEKIRGGGLTNKRLLISWTQDQTLGYLRRHDLSYNIFLCTNKVQETRTIQSRWPIVLHTTALDMNTSLINNTILSQILYIPATRKLTSKFSRLIITICRLSFSLEFRSFLYSSTNPLVETVKQI